MFFKVTKRYLDALVRLIKYHVRTRSHSLTLRKDHLVGLVLLLALIAGLIGMLVPLQRHSVELQTWVNASLRSTADEDISMAVPRDLPGASTDAMSRRIGLLCARLLELENLGAELQALAGLDDGEFSFSARDCESGPSGEPLTLLNSGIDHSYNQLNAMREILSDRKFAQRSWPSGNPLFGSTVANVTSRFGYRKTVSSSAGGKSRQFHKGLDLAAPYGSAVLAMGSGIVTYSGENGKYGNLVEIDHGNGFVSRYGHNSENLVDVGAMVRRGQMIARVGSTGRSTGPHVHVEVLSHGKAIDPQLVLKLPAPPQG